MLGCKNLRDRPSSVVIVIFAKYREISTRTMLPNFIDLSAEAVLYSLFGGHNGGVVKGAQRKRTSSKRSLRVANAVRDIYSVQLVAIKRDYSHVQNFKFGTRIQSCVIATSCT